MAGLPFLIGAWMLLSQPLRGLEPAYGARRVTKAGIDLARQELVVCVVGSVREKASGTYRITIPLSKIGRYHGEPEEAELEKCDYLSYLSERTQSSGPCPIEGENPGGYLPVPVYGLKRSVAEPGDVPRHLREFAAFMKADRAVVDLELTGPSFEVAPFHTVAYVDKKGDVLGKRCCSLQPDSGFKEVLQPPPPLLGRLGLAILAWLSWPLVLFKVGASLWDLLSRPPG